MGGAQSALPLYSRAARSLPMTHRYLSSDFLHSYEGVQPRHAGPLFGTVYLRTYSRWLEDKGRRERWAETVERVVNYSLSLYQGPASQSQLVAEAERVYDSIFHLRVAPAGRTLWVGGTAASLKFPEANYNCSFLVVDSLRKFAEMFHMLLCGSGVGFRIMRRDVAQVERTREGVRLHQLPYRATHPSERQESTMVHLGHTLPTGEAVDLIEVGDSKEGWVESLMQYLWLMKHGTRDIAIAYNDVRPKGERIRTFGGRAAGHEGLQEMFTQVHGVLSRCAGSLAPLDALDVCCAIALNVVVGGTRRSSLIGLGDPDDQAFIDAKLGLWTDPCKRQFAWRVMSNNSLVYDEGHKPTKQEMERLFRNILHNGEPGFFNLGAAKLRRPGVSGVNPCGEILLSDRGVCNLSSVVLSSHVTHDADGAAKLDWVSLAESIRQAVRIGMRQTNVTMSMPEWDVIQKRDRLTGVSLTGVMDALDRLGVSTGSVEEEEIYATLNDLANAEADLYAYEMRIPRPLLVTSLKPEGTISQLPTVSSGMHRAYAPHYIRRIRVSAMDPVCRALRYLGVPNEPDRSKPDRIVFSFPIASGAVMSASDESALSQYSRYLALQRNYTDHNTSCTLTFSEAEVPELIDAILANWSDTVAIALLPKYTDAYPQMPYEAITPEQYQEMASTMPNLDNLAELVDRFERGELEEVELEQDPQCAGGRCPIR